MLFRSIFFNKNAIIAGWIFDKANIVKCQCRIYIVDRTCIFENFRNKSWKKPTNERKLM